MTPPAPKDTRTAKEVLVGLLGGEHSMSQAEIARAIERDPRMIRKILNDESSGEHYRQALLELEQKGAVQTIPARRRKSNGDLVMVRGKGGKGAQSVMPSMSQEALDQEMKRLDQERKKAERKRKKSPSGPGAEPDAGVEGGTPAAPKLPTKPTRFRVDTTVMRQGGRNVGVSVPLSPNAKGREPAEKAVVNAIRSVAKGQRWDNKRIRLRVTLANGRTADIGRKWGYTASQALKNVNSSGGLGWVQNLVDDLYMQDKVDPKDLRVNRIEVLSFYHHDVRTYAAGQPVAAITD